MKPMQLTLLGKPLSTNSIYKFARGIMYMTKKGKELKKSYIEQINEQRGKQPIEDKVSMFVTIFHGDRRVRDIDNYSKILNDCLEGTVLVNDVQIYKLSLEKFIDKENPRFEIIILPYEDTNETIHKT